MAFIAPDSATPSSAARCFDRDSFPFAQTRTEFSRRGFGRAVVSRDIRLARSSIAPSRDAPRPAQVTVREQSHVTIREHFDFSYDTVTTAKFPLAPAPRTQRVRPNAQRICI